MAQKIDVLPAFWCAFINYADALTPNFRKVFKWFCTWYQSEQCTALVAKWVMEVVTSIIFLFLGLKVCVRSFDPVLRWLIWLVR